jgi:hypothetical protein
MITTSRPHWDADDMQSDFEDTLPFDDLGVHQDDREHRG